MGDTKKREKVEWDFAYTDACSGGHGGAEARFEAIGEKSTPREEGGRTVLQKASK